MTGVECCLNCGLAVVAADMSPPEKKYFSGDDVYHGFYCLRILYLSLVYYTEENWGPMTRMLFREAEKKPTEVCDCYRQNDGGLSFV